LLAGASDREILDTLVGNEAEELAGVGVASLLTERLSQEVGKRAERLFGLDRFSVNPFLVGQFANPTARVSVGKQITRELAINYSTNLNAATEAIILIEYTPEGPMSWILSRDEEGSPWARTKPRARPRAIVDASSGRFAWNKRTVGRTRRAASSSSSPWARCTDRRPCAARSSRSSPSASSATSKSKPSPRALPARRYPSSFTSFLAWR
jgi:hypothetical protein